MSDAPAASADEVKQQLLDTAQEMLTSGLVQGTAGNVAARLPDLALAVDTELPRRAANFVSGYDEMPVTFTPTQPVGA